MDAGFRAVAGSSVGVLTATVRRRAARLGRLGRLLSLIGVLAAITGCGTVERRSFAVVEDRAVAGFVDGKVEVRARGRQYVSGTVSVRRATADVCKMVESDLGFADFRGVLRVDEQRSRFELAADVTNGTVIVDLVMEIPAGAGYRIDSNHDEHPNFKGLRFSAVTGTIDEEGGVLSAGTYRVRGRYLFPKGPRREVRWALELDQPFELPESPVPKED
jgi:hypothetical protein